MYRKTRLELTDDGITAIMKMAKGNPGAVTSMISLMKKHNDIDPQSALGSMGVLLSLDTHGIYGSDIYVLFNDKCDRDERKMLMLLRSVQLGFLPESKLREMAADQMRKVNLTDEEFNELDKKVCERLEEFARPESA